MQKKQITVIITILVAVLVLGAAFLLLQGNSDALALAGADMGRDPYVVFTALDTNGNEYRVVADYLSEDAPRLVQLTRGTLGFWTVTQTADAVGDESGIAAMAITHITGSRRHSAADPYRVEYESHQVFCGTNATGVISIPESLLPENTTVSIHQAGSAYVLHFITFSDSGEFSAINARELLEGLGCIR